MDVFFWDVLVSAIYTVRLIGAVQQQQALPVAGTANAAAGQLDRAYLCFVLEHVASSSSAPALGAV